jgi:dihydropyrimidine dehydrogenase (NAD+) subunit PreT
MVIKATGQEATVEFLSFIPGLRLERGALVVNPETLQTTNPRYFAGGDCTNGGMSVVNAAADGKRAALGIDRYVSNKKRE